MSDIETKKTTAVIAFTSVTFAVVAVIIFVVLLVAEDINMFVVPYIEDSRMRMSIFAVFLSLIITAIIYSTGYYQRISKDLYEEKL